MKNKLVWGYLLLAGAISLWSFEASGYIMYERKQLNSADNIAVIAPPGDITWSGYLRDHHFVPADFQGLVVLPFFEIGTDKIAVGNDLRGVNALSIAIYASLQLHLPMIDAMMTRTSWSVAEKQVKLLAGPLVYKPILDDIKNDKPILLLHVQKDSLDIDQQYLLTASDFISNFQTCNIYALYPARLRASDKKIADSIRLMARHLKAGEDSCTKYSGVWYVNHFDSTIAAKPLFGSGAMPQKAKAETTIANIPVIPSYNNQPYEFSCWFLMSKENAYTPSYNIELLDSSGNIITSTDVSVSQSVDNDGLWFRSNVFLALPSACRLLKYRLFSGGKDHYLFMDELMLRPVDALILSKDKNGNIMANNHLLKPYSNK